MSTPFDPQHGLIIVTMRLWGPRSNARVHLALDTGATVTVIRTAVLVSLGYDPATAPDRVHVTTASGIEFVPKVTVQQIRALDQHFTDFPVVAHTLPQSSGIDGVLGLDFLRQRRLTIDFRKGRITLT